MSKNSEDLRFARNSVGTSRLNYIYSMTTHYSFCTSSQCFHRRTHGWEIVCKCSVKFWGTSTFTNTLDVIWLSAKLYPGWEFVFVDRNNAKVEKSRNVWDKEFLMLFHSQGSVLQNQIASWVWNPIKNRKFLI